MNAYASRMNQLKHDQVRQAFAARFRQALQRLGYSVSEQKAMRQLFGVSPQAVRKWADGQSMPSATRMPEVAAVLGVRRAWLQDGEEPVNPDRTRIAEEKSGYGENDALNISREELTVLQQYRQLSAQQQALMRQLMQQFIKRGD
jgi:transcriptional regulator with XRE-family HTH domain